MNTHGALVRRLSALVLFLTPIAGSGCAVSADPDESSNQEPVAVAEEAAEGVDPTVVHILGTCTNVKNIFVDTGVVDPMSSPPIELGKSCSDPFTIDDIPEGAPNDLYNIGEAAELCGRPPPMGGGSTAYLKYYLGPGVSSTSSFCFDYPNGRRWVSYVGCCAAGTTIPAQTVPITRTNRDCNGNPEGPVLNPTFGSVSISGDAAGQLVANINLQGATPNATYRIRLIQTPNDGAGSPECNAMNGTITTNASGDAATTVMEPLLATSGDAFVVLNNNDDPSGDFFTTAEVFF